MMRVLGLMLVGWLAAVTCVEAEPPGNRTPQERKKLVARWKGLTIAGLSSYRTGQVAQAVQPIKEALSIGNGCTPGRNSQQRTYRPGL